MRDCRSQSLDRETHADRKVDGDGEEERSVADQDCLHPWLDPRFGANGAGALGQLVLAGGEEEEQNRRQFQQARQRKGDAPLPKAGAREPVQHKPRGPQAPARDRQAAAVGAGAGLRVETDAEHEAADPAENLGVAVRLNPRRGNALKAVMGADQHQAGKAEDSAGQNHKEDTGGNPEAEPTALAALPGQQGVALYC